MNNSAASKYKQMSVKTATRGQILIMLYERAIQHIKRAALAIEKGDIAEKGVSIGKAHDIINELLNTLDHKIGGQVATDLDRLYNFSIEQLIKANIENKKEPLTHVQKNLETLLSAWREAVEIASKETNTK
jgi:flagellar protein FliS